MMISAPAGSRFVAYLLASGVSQGKAVSIKGTATKEEKHGLNFVAAGFMPAALSGIMQGKAVSVKGTATKDESRRLDFVAAGFMPAALSGVL